MTEPVTLFVNREKLITRLEEQLAEKKSAREAAKAKVEEENMKVRDQLVALLTDQPQFLANVAQYVRREFNVPSGESLAGLTERFSKDDPEDEEQKPHAEVVLEDFIRLYGLSDAEQIELEAGSDVLAYV